MNRTKHMKVLIFHTGVYCKINISGELFQNLCFITMYTGRINVPSDGTGPDNSNKIPSPSVSGSRL